jgi:hypothetical protein
MSFLQAALQLASKRKHIFPCRPGAKEPLTRRGFKDATTDPDSIRRWWNDNPDANLAIATGADSGLVVLDVDMDIDKGKDGEATLAALEREHGRLPGTLTVRTPRGGRHFYFKHPGGDLRVQCSTDKLGSGLDVRADGGYVIAPPSRTENGEYRWESKEAVAELPTWLLNLIMSRTLAPPPTDAFGVNVTDEEIRIRHALNHIPANVSHDEWVRILMALHSWDPVHGKEIARIWSATCAEKFQEPDFEDAWRSLKQDGGITLGTLFETARRHGWVPEVKRQLVHRQSRPPQREEVSELALSKWPSAPRPEAFYGLIGEYVRCLGPHTESAPMAILLQAIVGFGNVIGRRVHFKVEADTHYANLNVAIVGNSSKARKGTSWGYVRRLLRTVDPSWPGYITGLSTGEGLIHCVHDPVIKSGKDGGDEVVDAGVLDKRLLAVESEFGRTLQCSNREGNTLSAVMRQAFDDGDLRVATKGSPQKATGAHISAIGHITIFELNELISKRDTANGFANRFLWAAVKRSKLLPTGGNADSVDFRAIMKGLQAAVQFAKEPQCLSRDEEADVLWSKTYYRLSEERPGLLGAVTSRAEALIMRIAMIMAVTDRSERIRVQHLRAAVAIWDFCEESAAFIFGDNLGNPVAERVRKLLQDAGDGGLFLSAIYEGLCGHVDKEELRSALRQLNGQGLARFETVKTSGRPGQIWYATSACEKSEESAKKVRPSADEGGRVADAGGAGTNDNAEINTTVKEDLSSLNSLNSQRGGWKEVI